MIKGALVVGSSQIRMPGALMVGAPYDLVTLTQLIKDLFKSNEQGFTQTPDDLSTLYQDAAGTTPVTAAGQPMGLVLDKSKGLVVGAEKWVDSNVTFTGGAARISPNVYRIYSPDGSYSSVAVPVALTVGRLYKLTFNVDSITLLGGGVSSEGTPTTIFTTTGQKSVYFFATSMAAVIKRASTSCDIQISNISVKELAGNHAYQTTPSMRPILRYTPSRIDYDGIDDKLVTNLPAQLTGATIIRAVPNMGTQILTNQTIATPYNDSTENCGLVVINRALTQTETAQITQIFNRLAGV